MLDEPEIANERAMALPTPEPPPVMATFLPLVER